MLTESKSSLDKATLLLGASVSMRQPVLAITRDDHNLREALKIVSFQHQGAFKVVDFAKPGRQLSPSTIPLLMRAIKMTSDTFLWFEHIEMVPASCRNYIAGVLRHMRIVDDESIPSPLALVSSAPSLASIGTMAPQLQGTIMVLEL